MCLTGKSMQNRDSGPHFNTEYARKGAQNMSVLVMQMLLYFKKINLSGDW